MASCVTCGPFHLTVSFDPIFYIVSSAYYRQPLICYLRNYEPYELSSIAPALISVLPWVLWSLYPLIKMLISSAAFSSNLQKHVICPAHRESITQMWLHGMILSGTILFPACYNYFLRKAVIFKLVNLFEEIECFLLELCSFYTQYHSCKCYFPKRPKFVFLVCVNLYNSFNKNIYFY